MSGSDDRYLQSLFAQPAELPDSTQLLRRIASDIERAERHRRWRHRVLGGFALAGLALPVIALVALGHALDAGTQGLLSGLLTPLDDLRREATFEARGLRGILVIAAVGLLATAFAASFPQRER